MIDKKSIIFFTSDHGNMEGEHGERGHGQRESSWWNEKILVPFFICMPGEVRLSLSRLVSSRLVFKTNSTCASRAWASGRGSLLSARTLTLWVSPISLFSSRWFWAHPVCSCQVPTFMHYLNLSPPVDEELYSNGMSLLIEKGQPDPTLVR